MGAETTDRPGQAGAPKAGASALSAATTTLGRCGNVDYCSIAAGKRTIAVPIAAPFVCPECQKPLLPPVTDEVAAGKSGAGLWLGLGALVLVGGAAFAAYHFAGSPPTAPPTQASPPIQAAPPPTAAIAAPQPVAPIVPPAPASTVLLRLRGSNTIGAELGPKLAQAFLATNGDTDISIVPGKIADEVRVVGTHANALEEIDVAAHGSATAFTGLAKGDTDIGMASRRIKPAEVLSLASLGDMTGPASEHVLALDGLAVIVNPTNAISSLTLDQLHGIFAGTISDWSAVGGTAGPIHIFARDDKSGTYDTFKALVLDKTPLVPGAKRIEDSRELSADVSADPRAIGFIGLPYVLAAKKLALAAPGGFPLQPNSLTVATEDYPLARRLFLYTAASGSNPMVPRFTNFALSEQGQAIVEQIGFIPLTIHTETPSLPPTAPAKFRGLVRGTQRLSTNFRFQSGATTLDNRALADLDRLVNFVVNSHIDSSHLVLAGFADNQGSAGGNYKVSAMRAEMVANALAQRGIRVGQVAAFGADLPVADNSTDDGRNKNRRVEIYLKP